jgi:hypothetical protein
MSGEMRPHLQSANVKQLAWGVPRRGSPYSYVAPDIAGDLHHSMTWAWRILEYVPKNDKYKEWPPRHSYLGLYIPNAEPRLIPEGAFIHESALRRMESVAGYRPINLPARYQTYEMASSLLVVGDEYVDPIVGADHSSPHQLR